MGRCEIGLSPHHLIARRRHDLDFHLDSSTPVSDEATLPFLEFQDLGSYLENTVRTPPLLMQAPPCIQPEGDRFCTTGFEGTRLIDFPEYDSDSDKLL